MQGMVCGKPTNQGVTQLKPTRNLRSVAEERVGRKCGGLRVMNSYWINEVSTRSSTHTHTAVTVAARLAAACPAKAGGVQPLMGRACMHALGVQFAL
jgi:hypothetical protein